MVVWYVAYGFLTKLVVLVLCLGLSLVVVCFAVRYREWKENTPMIIPEMSKVWRSVFF